MKDLHHIDNGVKGTSIRLEPLLWAAIGVGAGREEKFVTTFVTELLEEGLRKRGLVPVYLRGQSCARKRLLEFFRGRGRVTVHFETDTFDGVIVALDEP